MTAMPEPAPREQVEEIVRALDERGVRAAPIAEATDLALAHPEAVADLARATIERLPKGRTFLDAALSYLPEEEWDGLVRFALDARPPAGGAFDEILRLAVHSEGTPWDGVGFVDKPGKLGVSGDSR